VKVEFHPLTADDFNQASDFYERSQTGISELFRADFSNTIDSIIENPLIFAEVKGIRRALLRRFPYSVLYRILDDRTVRILALRHHKRHPDLAIERQ
jgi:plasmid stabilization system protein ParE